MGTTISLEIEGMILDWSKNSRGVDHGSLFQEQDRKRVRSYQVNYDDDAEDNGARAQSEMALVRRLGDILPRLPLLGFTRERAAREYEELIKASLSDSDSGDGETVSTELLTFEKFCAFVAQYPVANLDNTYVRSGDRTNVKGRFADSDAVERIPQAWASESDAYSERSYFGTLIAILHPYSLLWVLGECERNRQSDIVWQYGPLVENGWASGAEFTPCARRTETFLIATEGSSDAHILNHAFAILCPEVSDFFRFIDVSERHPFPGTGNLVKFAEGLAKIDVQNQVVFLFDNDAEGYEAYEKVGRLALPDNLRAMLLPELEEFKAFPARGPQGVNLANINRRAAAIECYLDLANSRNAPRVVWTNYKKELDAYHGALEHKEDYMRAFLRQTPQAISSGAYDARKMRLALEALISECSAMAVRAGLTAF